MRGKLNVNVDVGILETELGAGRPIEPEFHLWGGGGDGQIENTNKLNKLYP